MGHSANDSRFAKSDFFDKSTYLSTNSRPRHVQPFQNFSERHSDLIRKGGDVGVDLGGKSDVFYDETAKERVCMKRLNAGIAHVGKTSDR